MPQTKTQRGLAYGLLATAMFAAYLLTNRYVYTTYDVDAVAYTVTFSLWAGFFALLSVGLGWYRQKFAIFHRNTLPVVWTGMLAGIGIGLIVLGQRYTTAVNASILATASTIPTILFTRILLKERFSRVQWAWVALMFVGLYLAIVGLRGLHLARGDSIILGAAVILGFTNTFSKVLMKRHSSDFVADVRLVSGGVLFLALGMLLKSGHFFVTTAGLWPVLGGMFYWLTIKFFYASMHYISPGKAIVLVNAHPRRYANRWGAYFIRTLWLGQVCWLYAYSGEYLLHKQEVIVHPRGVRPA
jgi:drug/metabolite transporter (DMT)-like permease